jgi:hypothetical protein
MHVANRAAENGSEIINDAVNHVFPASNPIIAIRVLEDTTITLLVAANVVNVAYYTDKSVTATDPIILGNFTEIHLTSGAVQALH